MGEFEFDYDWLWIVSENHKEFLRMWEERWLVCNYSVKFILITLLPDLCQWPVHWIDCLDWIDSVTLRLFVKLNKNKTIIWAKKPNAEFFTQLRWQSYTCRGASPITPLPTFLIRLVVAQIQHLGLLNLW